MPRTGRKAPKQAKQVTLILGDTVAADPRARAEIAGVLPEERWQLDLDIVRVPDQPADRAIECLNQVGMLGDGRCVWIRGLTGEPAASAARLLEFLSGEDGGAGVPQGCTLIATSLALDQRTRLFKWFQANAHVIDLRVEVDRQGRLKKEDVIALARQRVEEHGLPAPDGDALAAIAERAGGDVGQLTQEIDRLCLACPPQTRMNGKLVRTHMRDQADAWVYGLTNAISARRLGDAEAVLDSLLRQGEPPLKLLATLAGHVGDLLEASRLLGTVPASALRNPGAFARDYYPKLPAPAKSRLRSGFRAFYVFEGAAAFSTAELRRLHHDLVEIDVRLKSTALAPLHLFTVFLHRACAAERRVNAQKS